jgi:hypothetical protein
MATIAVIASMLASMATIAVIAFWPSYTRVLPNVGHHARPRAGSWYIVALVQPVGAESGSKRWQDTNTVRKWVFLVLPHRGRETECARTVHV